MSLRIDEDIRTSGPPSVSHRARPAFRLRASGTVGRHTENVRKLNQEWVSKSEIARRLSVSRTSVRRLLEP
jgi:hypothetical protein